MVQCSFIPKQQGRSLKKFGSYAWIILIFLINIDDGMTYICVPRLFGRCTGPFNVKVTASTTEISCLNSDAFTECIKKCIELPCCMSGYVRDDGQCEISRNVEQNQHFVKEIPPYLMMCYDGECFKLLEDQDILQNFIVVWIGHSI